MHGLNSGNERRIVFRTCIFMAGPLLAFTYSQLPILSPVSYLAIGLSLAWVYLSVEDVLRLSVRARALYLICASTCVLAILQQKPLWDYFMVAGYLACVFSTVWLFQVIKTKRLMGLADYFTILSFGLTLEPHMLGPWLLIACSIPLVGLLARRRSWSTKVPFIPYLTAGWMLASTLS
jgi:prepilin signal peptidase PulO-like enzyme (type II secretory pathway)